MKKALSLLLALVMITAALAVALPSSAAAEFSDVGEDRWSAASISYAVKNGYMKGVGGGKFDPDGSLTRAMVATVLWRREGEPVPTEPSGFTDVPADEWYADAVAWAKETGVVKGVTDKTFEPDGLITREQLATMLFRFSSSAPVPVPGSADLRSFPDCEKVSDWAEESLGWAVAAGLIKGTDGGRLAPGDGATREQFAAIVTRFDAREKEEISSVIGAAVEEIADGAENMLRSYMDEALNNGAQLFGSDDGILLIGLFEAGRYGIIEEFLDFAEAHSELPNTHPDGVWAGAAGYVFAEMYEITGEKRYLDLCEEILAVIRSVPTDVEGEIEYGRAGDEKTTDNVYIDGTGLCGIFLGRYAALTNDAEIGELARLQIRNYLKHGVIKKFGYAYHGYNAVEGKTGGDLAWGRGTGWLMLAMGSVVRFCGDEELNAECVDFIAKTLKMKRSDGMFGTFLNDKSLPPDTSATGLIMWGYLKAAEDGASGLTDASVGKTALSSLGFVKDGAVYGASGVSGGWHVYSSEYDLNTHLGQGATLAFLASYLRTLN